MAWILANWAEILLLILAVDRFVLKIWPDNKVAGLLLGLVQGILDKIKPPELK